MALQVGSIIEGTVTGIAKFGAFVELPDKQVGLVHISEISNEFVKDINDYLKVQDKVRVKVLNAGDKGKIALSIKQAQPQTNGSHEHVHEEFSRNRDSHSHHFEKHGYGRQEGGSYGNRHASGFHGHKRESAASFEDKLNRFLKDSDERLLDLKRNVESKRGGRGARRSD